MPALASGHERVTGYSKIIPHWKLRQFSNSFSRGRMALVIKGKTACSLCGKMLLPTDTVVSFPAFLKSTHPLAKYSDAAFHEQCFSNSMDAEGVRQLFGKYREIWDSRPTDLKNQKDIENWGRSAFAEFE
jgi:hypothetical protein